MFSGKTEELIRQLRRAQLAKMKIQVFKPALDDRYSADHVASHNQSLFPSQIVRRSDEILALVEKTTEVVGIDEGQFFDDGILEITTVLANAGKRVIVAGLDTDWKGQPFGPIPRLMAVAEVIRKQFAICMVCGEPAVRTQRLISADNDILVGSGEAYEARCRTHFDPEFSQRFQQNRRQAESLDAQEGPSPSP
ncbi:MAG: thymidine kinase [Bdellovibrionaceae bacterium]|nr:thymidine kinase [Bdellovibrionales bacterium]MCB9084800.1 thymidine kinase [Pseudobdellovibrionaceae bacterium]